MAVPKPSTAGRKRYGNTWASPVAMGVLKSEDVQGWAWDHKKGEWHRDIDKLNRIITPATIALLTWGVGNASGLGGIFGGGGGATVPALSNSLATIPGAASFAPTVPALSPTLATIPGALDAVGGNVPNISRILDIAGDVGRLFSGGAKSRAEGRVKEAEIQQAQDRIAQDRYRAMVDAINNENAFNVSRYDSDLGENARANTFGLNRYGADLNTSTAKNSFALGRHGAELANAGMDLSQRQFQLAAPGQRAGNAVRGDILSRAQDVSIAGLPSRIKVPTISGGLRPSMFSDDTRATGANITAQARREQERGDQFAPLPTVPEYSGPTSGLPSYQSPTSTAPSFVRPPAPPELTGLPSSGTLDDILGLAGTVGGFAEALKKYRTKPVGGGAV